MTKFGRGKGIKFMMLSRYARIKLVNEDPVLRELHKEWIEYNKKKKSITRKLSLKSRPDLVHDLRQTKQRIKLLHDYMKQRIEEFGYDGEGL